jgi:hypothetical protein
MTSTNAKFKSKLYFFIIKLLHLVKKSRYHPIRGNPAFLCVLRNMFRNYYTNVYNEREQKAY